MKHNYDAKPVHFGINERADGMVDLIRKGRETETFATREDAERVLERDGNPFKQQTYPEFVASRFKSPDATAADLAQVTGQEAQLLHATVGMIGEWLEYKQSTSRANMLEELADFWFFYNAGAQVLGVAITTPSRFPAGRVQYALACQEIETIACEMLDVAKRAAIYRKGLEVTVTMRNVYSELAASIVCVIEHHGFTLTELEAANVAKLSKRYPIGYSNDAAQARADKVE